jgi:SpoVK/Ycf46/Vps4 family AAA+-type ATPase
MQNIPEILKIIEGGLTNNAEQVMSYASMLAKKLDDNGEHDSATFIRSQLKGPKNFYAKAGVSQPALPVDKDSRLALGDVTLPPEFDARIILPKRLQETVDEFLGFINKSHVLTQAGVGIAPSMLLYGPPGCGKTMLAHRIASQLKLPMITARCDTLISSYLGSTAKNLRSLFDHAASRPCVLFLDEFDAFAKARDDQFELGELKRVVVSLLQNIDALPSETVLLAATNHESLLDSAVWRRFSYRLQLPLPDANARETMLETFLGGWTDAKLAPVADIANNMNGAEIEQACKTAIRSAILADKKQIDIDELILRLAENRYRDIFENPYISTEDKISRLKSANNKAFTVNRLAKWFGVSTGKVSKITAY